MSLSASSVKPIILVKEARKLLGKEYENLSDKKIAELVEQLHELAKLSLDMAREQRLKKTLGQMTPENSALIGGSTFLPKVKGTTPLLLAWIFTLA